MYYLPFYSMTLLVKFSQEIYKKIPTCRIGETFLHYCYCCAMVILLLLLVLCCFYFT